MPTLYYRMENLVTFGIYTTQHGQTTECLKQARVLFDLFQCFDHFKMKKNLLHHQLFIAGISINHGFKREFNSLLCLS